MTTPDGIRIQREDFDVGTEIAALTDGADAGAVANFVGLVRGDDGLSAMTLEHYPGMTEREIATHVAEARKRWPILAVRIVHRVGKLKPGERIVFVGVASAHRQAAFEAAQFLMDYLKTHAPFWKLEERDGHASWVEAKSADETAVSRWR
jgi:molybdopterin synthase catalytic subunit